MAKFKCKRCGEEFDWALDLAAHTEACPMPHPVQIDGDE